jgi:hypothetical protein
LQRFEGVLAPRRTGRKLAEVGLVNISPLFRQHNRYQLSKTSKIRLYPKSHLFRFFESGRLPALSNRAEFRARHGLDISLRFSVAGRLSSHAAWGLLDGGYASLGCTSVSRLLHRNAAIFCGTRQILQVILVTVKALVLACTTGWYRRDGGSSGGRTNALPGAHAK